MNIIHDRMLVTMYLPCIYKLTNNQIFKYEEEGEEFGQED